MRSHPSAAARNHRAVTSGGVAKASQSAEKQQAHQKKNVISSNHLFLITQRRSVRAASLHHSLLCLCLSPSRCVLLLRLGGLQRPRPLGAKCFFFCGFFFFYTIKLEIIHLIPMQQSAHSLSHTHTQERLCNTCHVTHIWRTHLFNTHTYGHGGNWISYLMPVVFADRSAGSGLLTAPIRLT